MYRYSLHLLQSGGSPPEAFHFDAADAFRAFVLMERHPDRIAVLFREGERVASMRRDANDFWALR